MVDLARDGMGCVVIVGGGLDCLDLATCGTGLVNLVGALMHCLGFTGDMDSLALAKFGMSCLCLVRDGMVLLAWHSVGWVV